MLELPKHEAEEHSWLHARELLLAAAETPTQSRIEDATYQLELALFLTGRQHDMPASS